MTFSLETPELLQVGVLTNNLGYENNRLDRQDMKKLPVNQSSSPSGAHSRQLSDKHGFTLIELMVVVTIIAFLSVIGVVSFNNIQAQSRDGRRRADIDAIATALESNRDPVAGHYPVFVYSSAASTLFANGKVPVDPVDTGSTYTAVTYNGASYSYTFVSTTSAYVVCARLEKGGGNSGSDTSMTAGTTFYCRASQQ